MNWYTYSLLIIGATIIAIKIESYLEGRKEQAREDEEEGIVLVKKSDEHGTNETRVNFSKMLFIEEWWTFEYPACNGKRTYLLANDKGTWKLRLNEMLEGEDIGEEEDRVLKFVREGLVDHSEFMKTVDENDPHTTAEKVEESFKRACENCADFWPILDLQLCSLLTQAYDLRLAKLSKKRAA